MLCDVASASGGVASAYIIAQIAGVNPVHHIAVLQGIAGTAVVGEPSVDAVHPPGQAAHVKLVQVVDSLHVGAVVHRCPNGLHVDLIVLADTLKHIEHTLALAEGHGGGRQNHAVRRDEGLLAMDMMPDSGSTDNKTDSGNTGNKTDSGSTGSKTDDSSLPKFPAFEGKDLDGNTVKSSDLFSGKAVTVVNFWFTTCGPCVGELGDLDALNKELSGKGGALIGINAFTLDGNEAAISDAKDVLTQSGATYQNVYFDSGSEAGKFVESIYAYPTTYVVNRSGRIVGDPIVGAVTGKAQAEALQAQIDKALAADMG